MFRSIALHLLKDFGLLVDDRIRVSRVVPYVLTQISGSDSPVMTRAAALHALVALMTPVTDVDPEDLHIFPDLVVPVLLKLHSDKDELVRIALAQTVVPLYECGFRLLDLASVKAAEPHVTLAVNDDAAGGSGAAAAAAGGATDLSGQGGAGGASLLDGGVDSNWSYSAELSTLQEGLRKAIVELLSAGKSSVKCALLPHLSRACTLLGRKTVNHDILPHTVSLNADRSWHLRAAFLQHLSPVGIYAGRSAFRDFMLPGVEQALFDPSPAVVFSCLRALLGLTTVGTLCLFLVIYILFVLLLIA